MSKIIVTRNVEGIEGLTCIEPKVFSDNRGYTKEAFNIREYKEECINTTFVQDNISFSKKSILRGFHVNFTQPQEKLIYVISGAIYDVAIDLREKSNTYMKWYGIELSGENHKQLFIPKGFGHGYLALQDSYICFKVSNYYSAKNELGFAWNSRAFDIDWPINNPILNEKDSNSPDFSEMIFR